jgi:hypothetical protein
VAEVAAQVEEEQVIQAVAVDQAALALMQTQLFIIAYL